MMGYKASKQAEVEEKAFRVQRAKRKASIDDDEQALLSRRPYPTVSLLVLPPTSRLSSSI